YRTALNAKRQRVQRQVSTMGKLEDSLLEDPNPPAPGSDAINREFRAVLDEALDHLPEKYRTPIVLCYLQGKSNEEAARQVHCEIGALQMRLSRARDMLRSRLARRGVELPVGALIALLAQEGASGAVPVTLATSTVQTGMLQGA